MAVMQLQIRKLLWLALLLALSVGVCYAWYLWTEKPLAEYDTRPPEEAISEYRQLLNALN